jgi:hypothetical protein
MKNLLQIFQSSNNYFRQDPAILKANRKKVDEYLFLKGYELIQRDIYLMAYDYFTYFPEDFDGATMTEDLPDIENLELAAMLHDYLYIKPNASGSFKYSWIADKLMRLEMRKMNKSSWNTGVRFVLLLLKAPFFVPFTYLFKGRRMDAENKALVNGIFLKLQNRVPQVWHKEYRGELTWTFIVLVVATGYVWRISLHDFVQSIMWIFR